MRRLLSHDYSILFYRLLEMERIVGLREQCERKFPPRATTAVKYRSWPKISEFLKASFSDHFLRSSLTSALLIVQLASTLTQIESSGWRLWKSPHACLTAV